MPAAKSPGTRGYNSVDNHISVFSSNFPIGSFPETGPFVYSRANNGPCTYCTSGMGTAWPRSCRRLVLGEIDPVENRVQVDPRRQPPQLVLVQSHPFMPGTQDLHQAALRRPVQTAGHRDLDLVAGPRKQGPAVRPCPPQRAWRPPPSKVTIAATAHRRTGKRRTRACRSNRYGPPTWRRRGNSRIAGRARAAPSRETRTVAPPKRAGLDPRPAARRPRASRRLPPGPDMRFSWQPRRTSRPADVGRGPHRLQGKAARRPGPGTAGAAGGHRETGRAVRLDGHRAQNGPAVLLARHADGRLVDTKAWSWGRSARCATP